jgi:hypothetical protein
MDHICEFKPTLKVYTENPYVYWHSVSTYQEYKCDCGRLKYEKLITRCFIYYLSRDEYIEQLKQEKYICRRFAR